MWRRVTLSEDGAAVQGLAEQLGRFFSGLHDGAPGPLEIEFQVSWRRPAPESLRCPPLKGLLAKSSEGPVSYVNAPQVAAERGLEIREVSTATSHDYTEPHHPCGRVTTRARAPWPVPACGSSPGWSWSTTTWSIVPPSPNMLVVRNNDPARHDRAVGTAIGDGRRLHLIDGCRAEQRGDTALMVITTDAAAPDQVLTNLPTGRPASWTCTASSSERAEGPVHPRDGVPQEGAAHRAGGHRPRRVAVGRCGPASTPRSLPAIERVRRGGCPCSRPPPRRPASAFSAMAEQPTVLPLPAVLFPTLPRARFPVEDGLSSAISSMHGGRAGSRALRRRRARPRASTSTPRRRTSSSVSTPRRIPSHMAFNVEAGRRCCRAAWVPPRCCPCSPSRSAGSSGACSPPVPPPVGGFAQASITPDGVLRGATASRSALGVSSDRRARLPCAAHGLAPRRLAVGDGRNDLELLAAASIRCVPEDGCEAAPCLRHPPDRLGHGRPADRRWTTSSAEVPRRASGGAGAGARAPARQGVEAPGHGQRPSASRSAAVGRPQALDDGGDTARNDKGEQRPMKGYGGGARPPTVPGHPLDAPIGALGSMGVTMNAVPTSNLLLT